MSKETQNASSRCALKSPMPGLVIYLVYMLIFYSVFVFVDVDYARVAESDWTLSHWLMPPILAGLVVTVLLVSRYDLWGAAFTERQLLPRWAMIVPTCAFLIAVINLIFGNFTSVTSTMWIYLIVGCAIVGFNEELVNRGTLIVALRSRFDEIHVWFLSCAMFGLFHLPNILFGIGGLAIYQVFVSFGMGSVFYLCRRTTGSLVLTMFLHGLWDFSAFASHVPYSGLAAPILAIIATYISIVVIRRESFQTRSNVVNRFRQI